LSCFFLISFCSPFPSFSFLTPAPNMWGRVASKLSHSSVPF
jgi:hypothetical protein